MEGEEQKKYQKEGFRELASWKNACLLRKNIYQMTKDFSYKELRRVQQMNDAARSTKQNIQEGYYQTTGRYIYALERICVPSLKELHGDVEDCFEDGLIVQEELDELNELIGKTEYLFKKQIQGLKNKHYGNKNKDKNS